jgi:hypothetical protein
MKQRIHHLFTTTCEKIMNSLSELIEIGISKDFDLPKQLKISQKKNEIQENSI